MDKNIAKEFTIFLLENEAIQFGDFKTKNGQNVSYYINTGRINSAQQLSRLGRFYADVVDEVFDLDYDVLFGPAYKGIPIVISTATSLFNRGLDVNYCFNRKETKDHGDGGDIVGYYPKEGDRIVIVDDVVTSGSSIRESIELIRSHSAATVCGVVVAVDRQEKNGGRLTALDELQEEYGIKVASIVTINDILEYMENNPIIEEI